MRKTKLLVSALSVAAILPLSSCGLERTNAKDYEGTLEMYRAFFEKTYEYEKIDNPSKRISLEGFTKEVLL